jgi:hypothetical protein
MVHKVEASASLTESIVTHNFLEPMPQGQKTFECEIRTHTPKLFNQNVPESFITVSSD